MGQNFLGIYMPKKLIAPAQEQVAFREYAPPLEANQIRVKSIFGAPKHGCQQWHRSKATLAPAAHMMPDSRFFAQSSPA